MFCISHYIFVLILCLFFQFNVYNKLYIFRSSNLCVHHVITMYMNISEENCKPKYHISCDISTCYTINVHK